MDLEITESIIVIPVVHVHMDLEITESIIVIVQLYMYTWIWKSQNLLL